MKASVKVVGMVAGGREHVVASVSKGDPVLLLPEPDNAYDPNAIAVYTAPIGTFNDDVVSSVTDPARIGHVSDADRRLLIDRQAGYIPRDVASRYRLPPVGIIGYVAAVRFAPPEYVDGPQGLEPGPARVAGLDVTAWWPADRNTSTLDDEIDQPTAPTREGPR
ncbi:MAG: HIRAN domain-containing protein [Dermatophilaceae bacterium]